MELLQVLRVMLRRWYMIALPVVVVAALTLPSLINAPNAALPPMYTTVIRYTAAQVLDAIPNRDGDYQDVWLASELTVNAFSEWVRSSTFAEEVRAQLAQDVGPDLSARNFAADNERSIGQVFITWRNAAELEQIAMAAQTVLQTRTSVYFPQLGDVPARVELLDTPRIVTLPAPITSRLASLLPLALALLAGIALAFLAEYLDPFLYRREQLETQGMPVLSSIPRHK